MSSNRSIDPAEAYPTSSWDDEQRADFFAGRFDFAPGRDAFAAYNGTAPIEVSSGNRVIHRLSQRGNRRLNHAIHMTAEGKTSKEALRCLKRRISNAVWAQPAPRRTARRPSRCGGPGRATGERLCIQQARGQFQGADAA